MTNDEILEAWHRALRDYERSDGSQKGQALYRKMLAEHDAIDRFGLGPHRQAYRRRFPDETPEG